MISFRKFLGRSYYKISVIITFSIVTIILVIIMSSVGYIFIRDLYLNQLSEQVNIITKMISMQLDKRYLEFFNIGRPTKSADDYFREQFYKNLDPEFLSEIFIFDNEFRIVIHSDPTKARGETEPKLFLNQKEIYDLNVNDAVTSLPFKGADGNWYLWGFCRLNVKYWLAVRESAARFEMVEDFSKLFWLIGSCGIILTILLSFWVAGKITKPIESLVSFSGEIGKGNFKISTPGAMKGEFDILAKAMDKMKQNLAENHKEREKILAQIAHEIRNPLGGIELLANLAKENLSRQPVIALQEKNGSGDSVSNIEFASQLEKNNEYLNKILKEVNVLKSLITAYLNYSRPLPAKPTWVDLPELLIQVKDIFNEQIKEKNINLVIDSAINVILFVEDHLRQIIVNLIANSLESVSNGGIIRIKSFYKNKQWIISVSDNGQGITQENLFHVFEPFFTTKKNGTGLGLAVSRKLCHENKAEIYVENNSNKGVTFTLVKDVVHQES